MNGYEYLKNFLREEGYKIQTENDSWLTFKYQGTTVFGFKNASPYLQLVVMCNTQDIPRSKVLDVCNTINDDKFVVKCIAREDGAWVCYEFEPSDRTSSQKFEDILGYLDSVSDMLLSKLSD